MSTRNVSADVCTEPPIDETRRQIGAAVCEVRNAQGILHNPRARRGEIYDALEQVAKQIMFIEVALRRERLAAGRTWP